MSLLYVFCYACVAVFFACVIKRFLKLARLPVHVRWELYPVAHEPGEKAKYGGSILEEPEWWTKPRHSSKLNELKVMVPEILLLQGVKEHNKSHWAKTFPFHFGLYLLIGATMLLVLGGLFGATGPGGFFGTLIPLAAYAGLALGLFGAVALLHRRMTDEEYRDFSLPVDFFNLVFFIAAFGIALLGQITADPDFAKMRGFFHGLFTFDGGALGGLQVVQVILLTLLMTYIPFTHMSHFFTKYFMYHDVRWSDEPMTAGSKLERRVGRALALKPTWAASHIDAADGTKTWVDVATSTGIPEESEGGES
ncbi:MAG: respiratory nitrate reductase subunit gamma [Planctomycetota bacterium]